MDTLNLHMKRVHNETENDRICRVTDTVKSALEQEQMKKKNKHNNPCFDCSVCGMIFKNSQEQNTHNQKIHASVLIPNVILDTKSEVKPQIVCELCDKVVPNRVQKSNHKLLVHT